LGVALLLVLDVVRVNTDASAVIQMLNRVVWANEPFLLRGVLFSNQEVVRSIVLPNVMGIYYPNVVGCCCDISLRCNVSQFYKLVLWMATHYPLLFGIRLIYI
jgi:hypothetical protein